MKDPNKNENWTIKQGVMNGKPIITRSKEGADKAYLSEFPFQIGIAVPLQSPREDGFPTKEEGETLYKIEDALENEICESGDAVFVMSITYKGMREFVFYSRKWSPETFEKKINFLKEKTHIQHQLQFMMQEDKDWATYRLYSKPSE